MIHPRTHPSAAPQQLTAWLNVAAKTGGAGISLLLYIVLARTMTPEAFADVAVTFAWLALAASFACFSAPLVLVRYVPETLIQGRADLARGVVQSSFVATATFATAIAGVTVIAIRSGAIALPRDLPQSAFIGAVLLLPSVLLLDLAGLLTSLKRPAVAELLVNVIRPALTLVGMVALWIVLRPPISAPSVLNVYLVASIIVVLVCIAYAMSILPRELARARPAYDIRDWVRSAGGFMAVSTVVTIHERIDILMMGLIASSSDVAVYAVAVRFAQTVVVAASAAGAVMAPHLVERLADLREGRLGELQVLVRNTARTAWYVSLIALAGYAALGPLFLKLFGPHYERAYVPLVLLATGQAIAALWGPAAAVATLAGGPRIAIIALTCGIVVNAVLNVLLVPALAAIGAALATATGMICASLVAWAGTRRCFRLDTSVFRPRPR